MSDGERQLAYCHACGAAMDVTTVAPFSNVACPACGKHTRVKREFGPYTLLRRHAIGGMSFVFVAHDNALDREVAVKILNEKFSADEKRIAAFEKEARLMASISHPHVVRLLTTGRAFGHFYLVMEFVSGGHFEHVIRERGSLPEVEVLNMALQVADGLRAAHVAGLIHRDVKPGNILFDAEGNAKIVDFGLALVTKGGSAKAEEIWATPYYVPPEAVDGRAEDFRSDLYAFGATLYHALAGKPPCSEESMATSVLREAKKKVIPLGQAAPWLGPATCAVIDRAMAYDPAARFASYEQLIDGLQSALQHAKLAKVPEPQPTTRHGRRAVKASKRWDKAALGFGVLAIMAALGVGIWWVTKPPPEPVTPVAGNGVGTVKPPVGEDPDVAVRVGRQYREAREALEGDDLVAAETRFAGLRDDPAVKEPTAMWAGFEAVLAALLDGRGDAARTRAHEALVHIDKGPGRADPLGGRLGAALERFPLLPVVPVEEATKRLHQASGVMVALLFAVKNWELGRFQEAQAILMAVHEEPVLARDEWLAPYRKVVDRYLADAKTVAAVEATALPRTPEECTKLAAEWQQMTGRFQTHGRARFHLHCRTLELARHRKALEAEIERNKEQPTRAADLTATMPVVEKLLAAASFTSAVEALKKVETDDASEKKRRDAWFYLAESAATFLGEIEESVAANVLAGVAITPKAATTSFDTVAGSKPGGLLLAKAGSAPVLVPWAEIPADGVIEIHRRLTAGDMKPMEKIRRHEMAIAYDFLIGDRKRAETAAAKLAKDSPAFGNRWSAAMQGLAL